MSTKVAAVIAVLVVAGALSTVSVVLRMITRLSVLRTAGPDDWCMAAAQVLCVGLAAVIGFECKFGLGRHITEVPSDDALNYFKSFYASILIYTTALSVTKISLLLQYRRIFPSPTIRKTSLGFLIFVAVWNVALIIWFSLICIPIDKFWTPELPGVCAPLIPTFYTPAAVNILTDCSIFIIPLPAIKTLKLPPRQKAILFGIFGIGFFVCGISFIRLYTLKVAANTKDSTWDNVDAAILSFLEVSMGILAGSLPTLRPLLGRIFPWLQYGQSQFTPSYGPSARNSFHASRQSKIKATRNAETESTSALHHDDAFGLGNVKSVTAMCDAHSRDSREVGSVTTKNSQNGIRATTTVIQQVTPRDMVG